MLLIRAQEADAGIAGPALLASARDGDQCSGCYFSRRGERRIPTLRIDGYRSPLRPIQGRFLANVLALFLNWAGGLRDGQPIHQKRRVPR